MIDLHLHTVFSDGRISDIAKIVNHCEIIAITDHNSIQACRFFSDKLEGRKMIIGCEVTVDRAPDYLIYFPGMEYSNEIEEELEKIRLAEESVIKHCYNNLGYSQWEKDIVHAYSLEQKIKNARTRDLAAIIHLYNNNLEYDDGNFGFDDLKIARKQRWMYAEKVGNSVAEDVAFDIASGHNGKIVLAHPVHTAIRRCPRNNSNVNIIKEKLVTLLKDFIEKSGKYIEWEYFSEEHLDKYGLSMQDIEEIREIIKKKSNDYCLKYTIGTDSHSLDNYDNALKWLKENERVIRDNLADWIFY